MNSRTEAHKLANQLGATLEYRRKTWHGGGCKSVDIYLPEGIVYDCNEGLDALHKECELDEDIWPYVVDDLRACG